MSQEGGERASPYAEEKGDMKDGIAEKGKDFSSCNKRGNQVPSFKQEGKEEKGGGKHRHRFRREKKR